MVKGNFRKQLQSLQQQTNTLKTTTNKTTQINTPITITNNYLTAKTTQAR